MTIDPVVQTKFERNLTWERSWPKCFLALVATVEIILAIVRMKNNSIEKDNHVIR